MSSHLLPMSRLTVADVPDVRALYARCTAFFTLIEGTPASEDAAAELLTERPPGLPLDKKVALGIRSDERLVGVVDVLLGYPDPHVAFIGLFLLDPSCRGRGRGAVELARLEAWLSTSGFQEVHLGVQMNNPAGRRFWAREGYRHLRDAPLAGSSDPTPTVHVLCKELDP